MVAYMMGQLTVPIFSGVILILSDPFMTSTYLKGNSSLLLVKYLCCINKTDKTIVKLSWIINLTFC